MYKFVYQRKSAAVFLCYEWLQLYIFTLHEILFSMKKRFLLCPDRLSSLISFILLKPSLRTLLNMKYNITTSLISSSSLWPAYEELFC